MNYKTLRIFVLSLLLCLPVFAGKPDTVFIRSDSLSKNRDISKLLWFYKTGDDSSWKSCSVNAEKWETTQLDFKNLKWNGAAWFRNTIVIDSALRYKSVAFKIQHYGASEIYLNGKLIQKFGVPSLTAAKEEPYNPRGIPFTVAFDSNLAYSIAIRYSNHAVSADPVFYAEWFGKPGITIQVSDIDETVKKMIENAQYNYLANFIVAGVFFALGLLYLFLFFFFRLRRENIFYSVFNFLIAGLFSYSMLEKLVTTSHSWALFYFMFASISIPLIFLSYLGFLYSIFYAKTPKLFYAFAVFAAITIANNFIRPLFNYANYTLFFFILFSIIEGIRIIYVAIKGKKPNSWIIGAGVLIFACFIGMMLALSNTGQNLSSLWGLAAFLTGLLCLPVTMAIYLARQMNQTNLDLEKQLVTVKELSQKEIEAQKKNLRLEIEAEKSRAEKNDAELRAKAAELQAKAYEAERRALEAENERKTRELEEARALQLSMLPQNLPELPNLDIAVYMKTATEVGGDYYDFRVSMDGTLTVVAGDATGHGMKAGTMVSVVKGLFNSYAANNNILFVFGEMSRCIKQMNFNQLAMCMTMLKISGQKLRLSSAGMPPVLIYRGKTNSVEERLIKGMPLGTMVTFPYEEQETTLNPGDVVFVMSDGFPEMKNVDGELFGYDRVQEVFASSAAAEPDEIIDSLKEAETGWTGNAAPDDDITFIIIKVKG
jgi:serine phosphatase RsbU (regulator of sigma subunit)